MIAAILAALAVCLLLWSAFYRRNWHKGVGVQLSFPEPAVYCGQEFHLREIIENRKRLPTFKSKLKDSKADNPFILLRIMILNTSPKLPAMSVDSTHSVKAVFFFLTIKKGFFK